MNPKQTETLEKINALHEQATVKTMHYWWSYSNMSTWQFWVLLLLIVVPLVCLYYYLDRKKALWMGFFGLNVHVWFQYADTYGVTHGLWNYPYKVLPFLPINVALDISLIPVSAMLLYQWTLNHHKNFYKYMIFYSLFNSFLLKPALVNFNLFRLYNGMNYFYLFLSYLAVLFISKWITDLFVHLQTEGDKETFVRRGVHLSRLFTSKEKAR
ncbi:CBO0543 family protein [Paenibacillus gansuensis]|uniref:CBO0543 family protein n=1 Tax=Paenibacillus gansuensis TaxID=306542 RepID=A0ABW5PHU1_9BACL